MQNFYVVDKLELPLWQKEFDDFIQYQQESDHRLAKNYQYDYLQRSDELTILVDDDDRIAGLACMLKWNDVATRVMYRWARDRRIERTDHVYGDLSKAILSHQLPLVHTPYAFIGLDGNRKRTNKKWADAAGWQVTEGRVLPKHHQHIAYIKLKETDEPFACERDWP
jgi:hypothetical protein